MPFLHNGGTCYNERILNQRKQLGVVLQRVLKVVHNLYAHSVQYAHRLVTTKRTIEIRNPLHSQILDSRF